MTYVTLFITQSVHVKAIHGVQMTSLHILYFQMPITHEFHVSHAHTHTKDRNT